MPPALDPEKRAAILLSIQAIADGEGDRSVRDVAQEHGVAQSSVSRIAKDAALDHVWERTKTASASRAKAVDNRARRAALSSAMLDDAERLRQRMWLPTEVITATGARVEVELPLPADARQLASALTAFVKSSMEVDAKDAEAEQHAAVDIWLRETMGLED